MQPRGSGENSRGLGKRRRMDEGNAKDKRRGKIGKEKERE